MSRILYIFVRNQFEIFEDLEYRTKVRISSKYQEGVLVKVTRLSSRVLSDMKVPRSALFSKKKKRVAVESFRYYLWISLNILRDALKLNGEREPG